MTRRNQPTITIDRDGPECRLIIAIRDIEAIDPDTIAGLSDALWDAAVEAREDYREGQRAGAAYEATREAAYTESRGSF